MERRVASITAIPRSTAPSRPQSGICMSAPCGLSSSLATTAVTSAVATKRTQRNTSEFSSSPRPASTPSVRQTSVGRKPKMITTR